MNYGNGGNMNYGNQYNGGPWTSNPPPPPPPMGPVKYDGDGDEVDPELRAQIQGFLDSKFVPHHQETTNIGLILGLAISIPLFVIITCILGCCIYHQRRRFINTKKILGSHSPSHDSNSYNHLEMYGKHSPPPITCTDPWAMDRTKVIVEYDKKLGAGAFCNVHKGHINGPAAVRRVFPDLISVQKFADCAVAVKLLPSFADDIARSDFNQEINFMKSLNYHPHLVCMLGYVSDPRNPLLLVEYCANGDLLHLIRGHRTEIEHGYENDQGLKIKNLVSFAWQISNGLEYVNSIGCIHRDVAARNVLVDADYSCKIGDFGLCRLTDNLLYTARGGRLPLRWMAIESLKSFEYSFKSDVWSYGILLWELLSLGEVPYGTVENQQLLEFLESGQRLQKPIHCPVEFYEIMKACWRKDPDLRPRFSEICEILRKILEAATEDYGYLIPISNLATVDNDEKDIRVDDV
ncbi:hypothetical protein FO519_004307 [Halicephalobus sp. NKZ332]|nr:hypothetical protein FO519_004307 [Halicephalobus sp. NKZ332]